MLLKEYILVLRFPPENNLELSKCIPSDTEKASSGLDPSWCPCLDFF